MTNLALPWLLLHQTHSAVAAGAVSAARYLPLLTFGLAAGLIADRVERRALMIAADVGRLVALGAVALVGVLGRVPPLWLLVLVVLTLGTGQLLFGVAYGAWLPDVTGDARLGQANAALESSDAGGGTARRRAHHGRRAGAGVGGRRPLVRRLGRDPDARADGAPRGTGPLSTTTTV